MWEIHRSGWNPPKRIPPPKQDEEIVVFRMEGYDTRNNRKIELICKDVATAEKLYPHIKDIQIKERVVRREK